jgi:ubiquinone/menaquinone biosynthesis C-methylase UbiE
VARDRDVGSFDERAHTYETGWRGRLHHQIADDVVGVVEEVTPQAARILDVGCGTGYLLRELAERLPAAQILRGVDAAPQMVEVARSTASDERLEFMLGTVENLPYDSASFDLVVSATSFDHWNDQRRGLAECARVLAPDGSLVLADLFSRWLVPTLIGRRRGKARTRQRFASLLLDTGFGPPTWHRLQTPLIAAAAAARSYEIGADASSP